MALRIRLENLRQHEMLQDLILAAESRYWEGLELLTSGKVDGGVYLLGYVAEMLLKHACLRIDGLGPLDPVTLGPQRTYGRHHFKHIAHESYHSVRFWGRVLLHRRRAVGNPLPGTIERELLRRVRRLYQNWWYQIRYRSPLADATEAEQVYDDVTWLRDRGTSLWR